MNASDKQALLRRLCALLAPDDPPGGTEARTCDHLSPQDLSPVLRLADGFRVLPALYLALRRRGLLDALGTEMSEALQAALLLNRARNGDLAQQARDLTETLAEIDVRPIYLKGMAHILGGSHPPGARMASDIDALVPEDRLHDALEHLQARGFGPGYDGPTPITWMRPYAYHAVPIRRPEDPAWIELHKGFFADTRHLLPASEIIAQARPVALDGWQAHVPCPEHQIVLAIAHATLRGPARLGGVASLRDGLDVMALARASEVDFTAIEARFRKARAFGAYAWYSALMQDLFGPGAVPGQRQDWSCRTRLQARGALAIWIRPACQRALGLGSPLAYAYHTLTDRRFRRHFVLLATDPTYRAHWRGGEH